MVPLTLRHKKALKENSADMGFSFDGDADRVIGIDSMSNVLDGDHILFFGERTYGTKYSRK